MEIILYSEQDYGDRKAHAGLIDRAKEREYVIKVMLNPTHNFEDHVTFDEWKRPRTAEGKVPGFCAMSIFYGSKILEKVISIFHANGLAVDDIYFDSYSAVDEMPDLDMVSGKMKVNGVEGFTGEWVQPELLS